MMTTEQWYLRKNIPVQDSDQQKALKENGDCVSNLVTWKSDSSTINWETKGTLTFRNIDFLWGSWTPSWFFWGSCFNCWEQLFYCIRWITGLYRSVLIKWIHFSDSLLLTDTATADSSCSITIWWGIIPCLHPLHYVEIHSSSSFIRHHCTVCTLCSNLM